MIGPYEHGDVLRLLKKILKANEKKGVLYGDYRVRWPRAAARAYPTGSAT